MPTHIDDRQQYFSVENYPQVYADVEARWQDPETARQYHATIGKLLHPRVHFAPGAEDRMEQEVGNGAQCAIAFTHGKNLDPLHIAGMAEHTEAFESLIGMTMIGAKASLFKLPLVGARIPDLGAIPVWRKKDVREKGQDPEEQERIEEIRREAGKAYIQTEITGMNGGRHLAQHVEGGRGKGKDSNPLEVRTVYDGFGRVVCGVDPDVDVLMMTAAFYYGEGPRTSWFRPTIYLAIPDDQKRTEPERVTGIIRPTLQDTLDHAVSLHRS